MTFIFIIATICAYIVKGMCGFANTLVFTSILSFSANNINITPTELLIGYPSNILIAYKERKSLSYRVWLPLALLVILGIIPGALFLKNADSNFLKIFFGFFIIGISIEMFLRERKNTKSKSSKIVLSIIGIISGMLCGLFGIGAFLAAYISRTTDNAKEFRGNLCFVFLIENTFRIILYIYTGILNLSIFKSAVCLLPFMAIGLGIGTYLSNRTSEKLTKHIIVLLLMLSGISLIMNNIMNLL